MALAELAVAKASLSATLFRPDPTPCSRDDIDHFFFLLNAAILQCSPANVQKCKKWVVDNLARSSPARVAALGKYLCALANSFTDKPEPIASAGAQKGVDAIAQSHSRQRPTSVKRKRLHILYILNDVLYHTKFREPGSRFAEDIEPFLAPLVGVASAFSHAPKHIKKIQDLVAIWEKNGYFNDQCIASLRVAIEQGPTANGAAQDGTQQSGQVSKGGKIAKEAPFVMPAMHGDPSTPWYDLPAGNWLPVLEPNSTRPMNPSMIKPLQLASGPADKVLVDAVKKLLLDVDKIYGTGDSQVSDAAFDVDQMGERIEVDETSGEVVSGETYYGWSREFCEKMKARRKKKGLGVGEDRGHSRSSRSSDISRSRSPRRAARPSSSRSSSAGRTKKRRLSVSPDGARRRRASSSHSRRRSPSEDSYRPRSWSRSRSRSRSRSPRGPGHPGAEARTQGYHRHSPPRSGGSSMPGVGGAIPYPPFPQPGQAPPFGMPPFPIPPMGAVPPIPPHPGFNGFQPLIPPPPPPNYQGPWPPPPPPPPQVPGASQNYYPAPPVPGVWPPPSHPYPSAQSPAGSMAGQYHNPQGQHQYRGGGYRRGGW